MEPQRPAWSEHFTHESVRLSTSGLPAGAITEEWAWGGSTGAGVKVAVVDSGVDNEHPAVAGRVSRWMGLSLDEEGGIRQDPSEHGDLYGHGTACAGIIRQLAPDVELASVRVLSQFLKGRGPVFAAGLRWAIDEGYHVINLSLGSTQRDLVATFHELVDRAYFRGSLVVTAANNMPQDSFPSLFSSVVSVASHAIEGDYDPHEFYTNPTPPPEFGAWGMNVRAAWMGGEYIEVTGNSFAAPHVAGLIAKILGKHPGLRPPEVKTVLRSLARNARGRL